MPVLRKGGRLANLSKSPDGKHLFKSLQIIENLVRFDMMRNQGLSLMSDKEIGKVIGRSVYQIRWLRNTSAYIRIRAEVLTGIPTTQNVENTVAMHKKQLKLMLPVALRTIYDAVQGPNLATLPLAERKFRIEVAKDILDREGTFPKISRTDSHVKHDHNFSDLDGVSKEILESIEAPSQEEQTENILNRLTQNKEFSQTETLSPQEMEASIAALEAMPVRTEIQ